jgi:hypothetical protein
MRNIGVVLVFTLFVMLILLPGTRSVNTPVGNPVLHNGNIQTEGNPYTPLPPKKPRASATTFVADGTPLPPPPKKPRSISAPFAASEWVSA